MIIITMGVVLLNKDSMGYKKRQTTRQIQQVIICDLYFVKRDNVGHIKATLNESNQAYREQELQEQLPY